MLVDLGFDQNKCHINALIRGVDLGSDEGRAHKPTLMALIIGGTNQLGFRPTVVQRHI